MRHKHADLIHAWAEGAEIECRQANGDWVHMSQPKWDAPSIYRIKPEKKPDVVHQYYLTSQMDLLKCNIEGHDAEHFLRCTFCGETGKLIKAEVL